MTYDNPLQTRKVSNKTIDIKHCPYIHWGHRGNILHHFLNIVWTRLFKITYTIWIFTFNQWLAHTCLRTNSLSDSDMHVLWRKLVWMVHINYESTLYSVNSVESLKSIDCNHCSHQSLWNVAKVVNISLIDFLEPET